jgi:phosphatidylserine decarboxylase
VPVAPQAYPFLLGAAALAALLGLLLGPLGAAPAVLAAAFILYFFRDPERVPPAGEGLVLAPADGRVTEVRRAPEGASISIFLSLFDCHINRSPVEGRVVSVRHTPGRFHPAWQGRASRENERNQLEIEAADGRYGVTQIAGVVARRIVCTKRAGDPVSRGERIGLIRFGSRTDLRLPAGVEPLVAIGQRVSGGRTILALARDAAVVAPGRATGAGAAR